MWLSKENIPESLFTVSYLEKTVKDCIDKQDLKLMSSGICL